MPQALFTNNAFSTLASGITNVETSLTVAAGDGALFPTSIGTDYFYCTLIDTSNNLEIVKVTAVSTDTFTVTRGAESTTAQAYSAGDRIELRVTAAGLGETVTAAVASAANAATSETNAATSETNAATSETNAEDWATKTDGIVESTDYSSKAWAIGGTGVTDTASAGAAKEWATEVEDNLVDGTGYSALHHAAKASASASAASTSETNAATSETNAATSETNAGTSETNAAASAAAAAASAAGIYWKEPVVCASTTNLTLSGEQTIDGILTSTSRVLVKNQTASEENGIYVTAAGAWARAAPLDTWDEHVGAAVIISQGTTLADTAFLCTADPGGVLGTTAITWTAFASAGLLAVNNLSDVGSPTTSATNLGLGTGDTPQFTGIELGHATDSTVTRVSAGVLAVEGNNIITADITASETVSGIIEIATDAETATGTATDRALTPSNLAYQRTQSTSYTGDQTFGPITETQTTKATSFTPSLTAEGTVYNCNAAITITMPSAEAGKGFTIIHDDGTEITWAGTIHWAGGAAPTAAAAKEIYVFLSDGTNWYGNLAGTGYA